MNDAIMDYKKANKLALIIGSITLFLGGIPQLFVKPFVLFDVIIIWILGLFIVIPSLIFYNLKKDTILIRYIISWGSFLLIYSLLFVQKGVFDNLFWLCMPCSMFAIF
jgi:hypothetical protein